MRITPLSGLLSWVLLVVPVCAAPPSSGAQSASGYLIQAFKVQRQGPYEYCGEYRLPGPVADTLRVANAVLYSYSNYLQKRNLAVSVYTGLLERQKHLPRTALSMHDAIEKSAHHARAMQCVTAWAEKQFVFFKQNRNMILHMAATRQRILTAKLNGCGSVKKSIQHEKCRESTGQVQSYLLETEQIKYIQSILEKWRGVDS